MIIKIRGHKRIWRKIEQWILNSKNININYLISRERDYVKFRVFPWIGITRLKVRSTISEPKSKTKQKILDGLFEIYDSWKIELDKLDEPYYLKIWLYEERFSSSQIVCAIRDEIHFYDNTFSKPEITKEIDKSKFGNNKKLDNYNWELRLDEDIYDNSFIGEPSDYRSAEDYLASKNWFEKMLLKNHRKYTPENPTEDYFELYAFEKGKVWLGEKK